MFCSSLTFNYENFGSNLCQPTTGLEDITNTPEIKVYPNPFANELTIGKINDGVLGSYVITDVQGRIIYSGVESKSSRVIYNGELLKRGVYFLKVENSPVIRLYKL